MMMGMLGLVLVSTFALAATGGDLEADFRSGLTEAKPKLGQLNAVQNRIFEDEIMRQPKRFIQDYRRVDQKLEVTVDMEGLKSYLAFLPKGKVAASFVPDPKCKKCSDVLMALKGMLKQRLDRRGVKIATIPAEDLGEDAPKSTEVHLKALDVAKKMGFDGAFVFQMGLLELGDIDTAHAEDHKYQIAISYLNTDAIRSRTYGEFLVSENLVDSGGKVMTDLFTDSGRQMIAAAHSVKPNLAETPGSTQLDKEETLVLIKGFKTFDQATDIRQSALSLLSKLGESEERLSARSVVGIAVFKDHGGVSLPEAIAALDPLMKSSRGDGLTVEIVGP